MFWCMSFNDIYITMVYALHLWALEDYFIIFKRINWKFNRIKAGMGIFFFNYENAIKNYFKIKIVRGNNSVAEYIYDVVYYALGKFLT